MQKFQLDAFAWIPQAEVPNPIHDLPGGVTTWGPGACGPYFGGDNFVMPPPRPETWPPRTFRATQCFAIQFERFGESPKITQNSGVNPGTTTVLSNKRAAGGSVCYSLKAKVLASDASVRFEPSDGWYEIRMHGAAQDPVPAAAATRMVGAPGGSLVSAMTPNLEWDLIVRIQAGMSIPAPTRALYAMSRALNLDTSVRAFGPDLNLGKSNLIHGTISVRRFPSYVVYLTMTVGGAVQCIPLYYADASSRGLAEIVVLQTDVLRNIAWQ